MNDIDRCNLFLCLVYQMSDIQRFLEATTWLCDSESSVTVFNSAKEEIFSQPRW